jgi:hypothetical protein
MHAAQNISLVILLRCPVANRDSAKQGEWYSAEERGLTGAVMATYDNQVPAALFALFWR